MMNVIALLLILTQMVTGTKPRSASTTPPPTCTDGPTTNLVLRIEPESISGCGSFTTWPDTSGAGNTVTMSATTTCHPTGGSNGGPYVTITTQHGNLTPLAAASSWTVFSVNKPASTAKGKLTENSVTGGAFAAYTQTHDGADIGATVGLGNGTATIPGGWYQWAVTYDATSGLTTYYINSTTDGTFTQTGSITNTIDQLFSNNSNSEQWSGDDEGLFIFQSLAMTAPNVALWQAYFVCKRGVS